MRLFTAVAPIEEVVRDQRTTPDVVNTSNASNMAGLSGGRVCTNATAAKHSPSCPALHFGATRTLSVVDVARVRANRRPSQAKVESLL